MSRRFDRYVADLLAPILHARTDGNPLFIEAVVQSWLEHGQVRAHDGRWHVEAPALGLDPPAPLRDFLEQQLRALPPPERSILEAASVAGSHFCNLAITSMLQYPAEQVESTCVAMSLASKFFHGDGTREYPDGSLCDAYRFKHSLFADIIYNQLTAAQRVRLHGKMSRVLREFTAAMLAKLPANWPGIILKPGISDRLLITCRPPPPRPCDAALTEMPSATWIRRLACSDMSPAARSAINESLRSRACAALHSWRLGGLPIRPQSLPFGRRLSWRPRQTANSSFRPCSALPPCWSFEVTMRVARI